METTAMIATIFVAFLVIVLFSLPFVILQLVAVWKTLKKAGEKGWKCLIPFYGDYTIYKIAGRSYWPYLISLLIYILTYCVGEVLTNSEETVVVLAGLFVNLVAIVASICMLVFNIMMAVNLSKRFGYSGGYAAIYFFVPIVFWCILGFSRNQYIGEAAQTAPGNQPQYNPNPVGFEQKPANQNPVDFEQNPTNQNPFN